MDKEQPPLHPLEDFPFEDLDLTISRRDFFSTVFTELYLRANRQSGASGMKLSSLGSIKTESLGELIPVILPDCQLEMKNSALWGRLKQSHTEKFLFELDPISTFVFNQFNGQTPICSVAGSLAQKFSLAPDRSFRIVRGLFLTLVKAGVCLPINNPLVG